MPKRAGSSPRTSPRNAAAKPAATPAAVAAVASATTAVTTATAEALTTAAATLPATAVSTAASAVVGDWARTIGEAISSPGLKTLKRNKKLGLLTPGGNHLSEESACWLAHHQELSQQRLERRCARLVRLRQLPAPGAQSHSARAAPAAPRETPLVCLCGNASNAVRRPPLAPRGAPSQVLLLELEGLLADRYPRSFWKGDSATSFGRSGLAAALQLMSRRFLLCALCRSSRRDANELLTQLAERSVAFDGAYLIPPAGGRGSCRSASSPSLDDAAVSQLCAGLGVPPEAASRRLLLVASVPLGRIDFTPPSDHAP